jgi:hypothetical protein
LRCLFSPFFWFARTHTHASNQIPQKHHDEEEEQRGQQQKDDGEKEEARETRVDGPNDTGVGEVHRGTKEEEEEKKKRIQMRERESRQKTKLENRER